ncbi:histidine decarboxylase-like [Hyposmocoma kahamanoa]|uniref:histidine decarboxylase-like n=1 Tax=Hyposmocoma kahamanoa TaxID=1477025 RepID=UPI000E6D6AFC|nr:histidine decarboxylase-like [Hyposmocoma kahamanoa]
MDHTVFRVKAKEMVDYVADYLENIRDRRVYPGVEPGFLHKLLPSNVPEQGEKWDDIIKDFDEKIMPGLVHWQSPRMHAYFPALTSYPSIMGELLSASLNVLTFTWASSPAGTELETIAMNWLGKLLGLPDCFLNEKDDSTGGGVIQTTASEATLVSLLAARTRALMELSKLNPDHSSSELLGHLVAYCSDQAHSSVEKAGLIGLVRMRYIESDEMQSMRGDKLEEAILGDKAKGLVPFWHWQIPLSRRLRSLKLWFVLRTYGVAGLQKHIRESVRLAQKFEALVLADPRFEIPQPRNLGLVAFRLKGDNTLTERLLKRLNGRGNLHAVPACFKGIYVIRFTVTSERTTNQDILDDWNEIKTVAKEILVDIFGSENGNIAVPKRPRISLRETRELNATFGTSLLLANSPMSPKIVNGTHVAICDYEKVLSSCAQTFAQLKMEPKDSPEMRRRIRGIKMVGKKFSLDSCMDMVQGLMVEQSLPQCSEDDREDASNGQNTDGVETSA